MHALVDDCLPVGGKSLQTRNQSRDGVGDPWIVLNVCDSVEVARKGLATACEKVVHVALHERLIRLCLVQIRHRGGAVDHRVTTRAEFGRRLLQIVPMLDDQTIFEAKDVEADAWPEEVVFRVSEDIIAVFKDADRMDGRIGRHVLDEGGDTCRTRSDLQVVLDILIRIDICERNRIFGLKRLQQIDDLLFTAGRHGSSGTISLFVIMDHTVLYLQASQSNRPIMLQWDDENCSPEKMSSTKRFPSSGSMALPRRVFRTLSRPRGCANPAYMQSSKTKRTYLSRAYANILTC